MQVIFFIAHNEDKNFYNYFSVTQKLEYIWKRIQFSYSKNDSWR